MAGLQRVASSLSTSGSSYTSCIVGGGGGGGGGGGDAVVSDQFWVGLRVLVVDDDPTCLMILEQMLRRCLYLVTTCSQAEVALDILRERKGSFDVVLSDVHMPDMDGYKLLEHVGLEMDLPVIMMSADGRTSAVMKGIRHGACDYLIKPVREEELKNIWQHVIRKKKNGNKEVEHSGSLEDNERHKRGNDDIENASSAIEGTEGSFKGQKKRGNTREDDDGDTENDDPSTSKKPRVVWSVELHQQFVSAVNQLGIDKAVPKRILELMNVPGLTRENVASHLQKFRLYLKRISGVAQQGGIPNALCGSMEPNLKLNPLGRFDIQALAASGQISPQTLAALHAELYGRPTAGLAIDQPALLQMSIQGPNVEHGVAFGQPLIKCQPNISKHYPQNMGPVEEVASGYAAWPSNGLCMNLLPSGNNIGGMNTQNNSTLMDVMQQQKQQHQPRQQSSLPEPTRSINVQPSCHVVPSQSAASFQAGNNPVSNNQSCTYNRSTVIDYSLLSAQSNNSSLNFVHMSNGDPKTTGVVSGHTVRGSISPSVSSSLNADGGTIQQVQNSRMVIRAARQLPGFTSNMYDIQGSYGAKSNEVLDQGSYRNLVGVGRVTNIPSRFAASEYESPMSNLGHGRVYMENNVNRVKQEPSVELIDNARVGIPMLQQFPPSDLMSVLTD